MRHWLLVLTCTLVCSAVGAQPQFEPVATAWIDGTKLVASELNVSLVAPGPDWEWLISSAPAEDGPNGFKVLACRNPDGSKMFLVAIYNPFWAPLDEDSATELVAGVRHGLENSGFTVGEATHEQTDVPLPGSDHFTMQATTPDGIDMHIFGYSAASARLFQFQHASVEPTESSEFRTFVESFELVGELPERFPEAMTEQAGNVAFAILTFLTVIVGIVGWIINRVGGRVVINAWTFLLVFLGLYLVGMSAAWWLYAPEGLESYTFGYVHGRVILGPVMFLAIVAAWRWRRVEQKRADA